MIFSYSRLNMYDECPFRFFKKYVEGYEEPTTLPLALGKAVHKTVEDKINGVGHSEAVLNGYAESEFHPEVTYKEISELASRAKIYPNMGMTEVYFELPLDDCENAPKIRGYIDVLGYDGKFITDWKTNRVMYDVLDTFQIGLYAWATHKIYQVSKVVGTLFFLRFRKASTHVFDLMDMEKARIWALGLATSIDSKLDLYAMVPEHVEKIFPARPSSNCRHCPFALECYQRFCKY